MSTKGSLKTIFKGQASELAKALRPGKSRSPQARFEKALLQSRRFRELLFVFNPYFSRTVQVEITGVLENLAEALEEARERGVFLELLNRLAREKRGSDQPSECRSKKFGKPAGKPSKKQNGLERIFLETSEYVCEAKKSAANKLKRTNLRAGLRDVLREAGAAGQLQSGFLVRVLEERRKALFNQIVDIIRTSQKEDFNRLKFQVERFIYLLEFAVQARYEKAKRLLQIVKLLFERLVWVQDEEMFGQYLREMERERAGDSERVRDIQEIREILRRLGIVEAHTLQALHAQLPVSLQFLKREIAWD